MNRSFRYFSILSTGVPQPLVFTTLSSAVAASTSVYETGNRPVQILIPFGDAPLFKVGDWLLLMETNGTNREKVNITEITGPVLTIRGVNLAHSAGSWVIFNSSTNSPYIQTKLGNAGAIVVGTDFDMNTATGLHCVAVLAAVAAGQPSDFSTARPGSFNPEELGQYWITGTAGDGYLPSAGII